MPDDLRHLTSNSPEVLRARVRELEAELEHARQNRHCQLLEALPAVPWEATADDFRFLYVGPQAEALLNFPPAEWYAPGFWESRLHPEDRDEVSRISRIRAEETRSDDGSSFDYRMIAADGRVVWIKHLMRVINIDDKPSLCRGLLVDVTQIRQEEQQKRERLEQDIQESKRESLGVMAGGIAHAFNNLLTGVLGYTELAARELPAGSPAHGFLDEVTRAGRRGAQITSQLLLHAGKGRFKFHHISLSALVQDMGRQLLAVIPKNATLRFECAGGCPFVAADTEQVRAVILELVTNAGEALGEKAGSITVRTGVRLVDRPADYFACSDRDMPGGTYGWLEVEDSGAGIKVEMSARIFEPFFSTRFPGRGLGLAAVLGIVQAHQGLMRVTSAPSQGTKFEVLFPAVDAGSDEEESDEDEGK